MGLFRKFVGFLGFGKDDPQTVGAAADGEAGAPRPHNLADYVPPPPFATADGGFRRRPSKGFSVQVPVVVEKVPDPVLAPCEARDGGVQGLDWHLRRLRVDEDGDVADEFLEDVLPVDSKMGPQFRVNPHTRQAGLNFLELDCNGNVRAV